MSGTNEDFDLFAMPIHEYCRPSIASGITPVAPPRASGSWAQPSDAEYSQGRLIARRLLASGASSSVPQSLMEQQDLVRLPRYAWQTSLQSPPSVREEARPTIVPQPLMEERRTLAQFMGSAPVGAVTNAVANTYGSAEDLSLAHDVTFLRNLGPTGDLRPSVKEWRRSAVIRQFFWCCVRCRVTNRNDEASCHKCHDTKDAITGSTSTAEHASLLTNTQGSAYGRSLECLKDRDQRVALGAPVEMGAPGYIASIRALVASINVRSDASRVERTVDESVSSFDGYLALMTSGRLRFWTADDVQKCMRSGELEAMIAEFVTEWGRTTPLPNGVIVQALPKGGWWWRTLGQVTEHHVLVVRSIIAGRVMGGPMCGGDSRALLRAILEDATFDMLTYTRVAAVAASLFAHMAVRERSEQGRATRAGGPCAATVADYAANVLRTPRSIVAHLVQHACSLATSQKLFIIERSRLVDRRPCAFALQRGLDERGVPHVLMHFDKLGEVWIPEARLVNLELGKDVLKGLDALVLPSFGYPPHMSLTLPVSLVPMRVCNVCGYQRPEFGMSSRRHVLSAAGDLVCFFCVDAGKRVSAETAETDDAVAVAASEGLQLVRSLRSESGFKGVLKLHHKFQATCVVNGKRRSLGSFLTSEEAALCYARYLGPERSAAEAAEAGAAETDDPVAVAASEGLQLVRSLRSESGFKKKNILELNAQ